ncbi:MAG: hypothetical protein Q9217_006295, partial [Psora testacea]
MVPAVMLLRIIRSPCNITAQISTELFPKYLLLDQDLHNRYGIPITEQFKTPNACPVVWPPRIRNAREREIIAMQYRDWVQHTMDDLYTYQNDFGETPALTNQRFLTEQSDARLLTTASSRSDARHVPYPLDQAEHIMALMARQLEPHAQPAYNVIQHTVPWGCGRYNTAACLVGHNIPNGPMCPYLLAYRLPKDQVTTEATLLRDFNAINRGGAVNDTRHGAKDKIFIRSALGTDAEGDICPLPLNFVLWEKMQEIGQVKTPGSHQGMVGPEMWYFYVSGEMPPP